MLDRRSCRSSLVEWALGLPAGRRQILSRAWAHLAPQVVESWRPTELSVARVQRRENQRQSTGPGGMMQAWWTDRKQGSRGPPSNPVVLAGTRLVVVEGRAESGQTSIACATLRARQRTQAHLSVKMWRHPRIDRSAATHASVRRPRNCSLHFEIHSRSAGDFFLCWCRC